MQPLKWLGGSEQMLGCMLVIWEASSFKAGTEIGRSNETLGSQRSGEALKTPLCKVGSATDTKGNQSAREGAALNKCRHGWGFAPCPLRTRARTLVSPIDRRFHLKDCPRITECQAKEAFGQAKDSQHRDCFVASELRLGRLCVQCRSAVAFPSAWERPGEIIARCFCSFL